MTIPASQTARTRLLARTALLVAVTAVAAQLAIPLPGGVPFTLQVLAVLLTGLLLPPVPAVAAQATYLLLGALGLPVFAQGHAGAAVLAGPTGGYLWGFPLAAGLVAALARPDRGLPAPARALAAALAGLLPIYGLGVTQLATHIGWAKAVAAGLLPFVGLDAVKALIAVAVARRVARVLGGSVTG